MSQSLDALDQIVDGPRELHSVTPSPQPVLILLDDAENRPIRRAQVETAQAQLPELRVALDPWLRRAPSEPAQ